MTKTAYWRWFVQHNNRLHAAKAETAADSIQAKLKEIDARLGAEVSDGVAERELTITTGGNPAAFGAAEELVSIAPSCPGWNIRALKPAHGFAFTISIGGLRVDASTLRFDPLTSDQKPKALGIRVFIPRVEGDGKDLAGALRLIVETGIGEKAAASITHMEIAREPHDVDVFLPIDQLGQYVDWFHRRGSGLAPI